MSHKRPMLFYAEWPLGYHNIEAERKASGFAEGGYEVVYVAGIGVRNPRISNLPKLADRARRKLGSLRFESPDPGRTGLRTAALLVAPPRQPRAMRQFNAAWLERQLRRAVPVWRRAVAWMRFPTPELVDALAQLRPAIVVYECVDPHHLSPGITGQWAEIHLRAERALVARADLVVVPGQPLAERFRSWGARVRVVPHGVDMFAYPTPPPQKDNGAVIGFVGTLDYRIDVALVRRVAEMRPEWHLRLVGPVQSGFDPAALADLTNVSVEPPVRHEDLGDTIASFHAGIMPYRPDRLSHYLTPVKNLEFLAAGRPAVAPPLPALTPYADLLYFADTPDRFVEQLEHALEEDSAALAPRRHQAAAASTWDHRTEELRSILNELLSDIPSSDS